MTFDTKKCPFCGADSQGAHFCSEAPYGEPAGPEHDEEPEHNEDECALCSKEFWLREQEKEEADK